MVKKGRCVACEYDFTVSLAQFPRNPKIRQEWIKKLGLEVEPLKCHAVCYKHFSKRQFFPRRPDSTLKPLLLKNAVPDLNLPSINKLEVQNDSKMSETSTKKLKKGRCCIKNCDYDRTVSLSLFPKNPKIRQEWLKRLGLKGLPVKYATICYKHFSKRQFFPRRPDSTKKPALLRNALPDLYLPTMNTLEIQNNDSKMTDEDDNLHEEIEIKEEPDIDKNFEDKISMEADKNDPKTCENLLKISCEFQSTKIKEDPQLDKEKSIDSGKKNEMEWNEGTQKFKCCVKFCQSYGYIVTFGLPKDLRRRQEWIELTQISEKDLKKKNPRICYKHFTKQQYYLARPYSKFNKFMLWRKVSPKLNLPPKLDGESPASEMQNPKEKLSKDNIKLEDLVSKGSKIDLNAEPYKTFSTTNEEIKLRRQNDMRAHEYCLQEVKCCVKFCNSLGYLGFYRFPKEPKRRQKWIELTQTSGKDVETKDLRVCYKHFGQRQYFARQHRGQGEIKFSLLPSARPNLNLPLQSRGTETSPKLKVSSKPKSDADSMVRLRTQIGEDGTDYPSFVPLKIDENSSKAIETLKQANNTSEITVEVMPIKHSCDICSKEFLTETDKLIHQQIEHQQSSKDPLEDPLERQHRGQGEIKFSLLPSARPNLNLPLQPSGTGTSSISNELSSKRKSEADSMTRLRVHICEDRTDHPSFVPLKIDESSSKAIKTLKQAKNTSEIAVEVIPIKHPCDICSREFLSETYKLIHQRIEHQISLTDPKRDPLDIKPIRVERWWK